MGKKYGTAWNLQLVKGDIVELTSESGPGSGPTEMKVSMGIVCKGPETETSSTEILYLADEERKFSDMGETRGVWCGFRNFRRLIKADKAAPIIAKLIEGLESFKSQ